MSDEKKQTFRLTVELDTPTTLRDAAAPYADGRIEGAPPATVGWLKVHLSNGNDVFVGIERDHPHGGTAVRHELYANQPEGHRTRLAFSLTMEAVAALVALYSAHGVVTRPMTCAVHAGPALPSDILPSIKLTTTGGHYYPGCDIKEFSDFYTSDCAYKCGCWMGGSRSGGPEGVDPFGDCPKNQREAERTSA